MKKSKITKRSDYAKATGYDVTLSVTYRRTRKVRAMDEKQAAEFAAEREMQYASKYYNSVSHIFYEVSSVGVEEVMPSSLRLGGIDTEREGGAESSGEGGDGD